MQYKGTRGILKRGEPAIPVKNVKYRIIPKNKISMKYFFASKRKQIPANENK